MHTLCVCVCVCYMLCSFELCAPPLLLPLLRFRQAYGCGLGSWRWLALNGCRVFSDAATAPELTPRAHIVRIKGFAHTRYTPACVCTHTFCCGVQLAASQHEGRQRERGGGAAIATPAVAALTIQCFR